MATDKKDDDSLFTAEAIRNLIDLGGAIGGPITSGGSVFQIVPQGWELRNLEQYEQYPRRPISHPQAQSAGAFVEYVKAYKQHDESALRSVIFMDGNNYEFLAILDYHDEQPGWGEHNITWKLQTDSDFQDWREHNEKAFGQTEFALFLEDHLPNIAEPDGATLLELVQELEVTKSVEFKSQERLHDGSRVLHYSETVQKAPAKGKLEFPKSLKLRLPIFRSGAVAEMEANLRFRLKDGQLHIFYKLMRLQEVIDNNLDATAGYIESLTGLAVWPGTRR